MRPRLRGASSAPVSDFGIESPSSVLPAECIQANQSHQQVRPQSSKDHVRKHRPGSGSIFRQNAAPETGCAEKAEGLGP